MRLCACSVAGDWWNETKGYRKQIKLGVVPEQSAFIADDNGGIQELKSSGMPEAAQSEKTHLAFTEGLKLSGF